MKRPHHIRIGAFCYKVVEDATLTTPRDAEGVSLHQQLLIGIGPDLAPERKRETLLHEVLHCFLDQSPMATQLDKDVEESVVAAISPLLFTFLRQNPELLDYLLDQS